MLISKTQLQNILKVYGKSPGAKVGGAVSGNIVAKNDELAISRESKIKQKAMQAIKQTEDIRLDRVNELEEQISAGTYTVSDDEVAERIIETAILDRLI
ncbi:MAG: flagellar biosynthesis anti-sigma factor FlgM [Deltaproteobacteria bacterium]